MTHLIDKSALVAKIEKLEELYCYGKSDGMLIAKSVFDSIKNIINAIEVKEVDLDKEIDNYISSNFFGSQAMGFFANRTKEEPNDQDIALCAKHFFELGMAIGNKAQKGEQL